MLGCAVCLCGTRVKAALTAVARSSFRRRFVAAASISGRAAKLCFICLATVSALRDSLRASHRSSQFHKGASRRRSAPRSQSVEPPEGGGFGLAPHSLARSLGW